MNCPHCQKNVPGDYSAVYCPFCGLDLPSDKAYGAELKPKDLAPVKFHVSVFFMLLLVPPILTMISARLIHVQNEPYSTAIGFFGGGAAGIICGILLGLRLGRTLPVRVVLSMFFAAIMTVVCIMLCFFGCSIGGYQFKLN